MMNIVVPMAGSGSRFAKAGYTVPKPFIKVVGKPMVELVLDNLAVPEARLILIARAEHMVAYREEMEYLKQKYDISLVTVNHLTEGAACTVMLAARLINTADPLLLANSDQLVDVSMEDFVEDSNQRGLDGSILTFPTDHPKWSYAKVDASGLVTEVREKVVVSNHATVGIYYFGHGQDFVNAAAEMIASNDRHNNEFYVAPAYNYAIAAKQRFGIYEISEKQMHGLGTPEDLEKYSSHQHVALVQ